MSETMPTPDLLRAVSASLARLAKEAETMGDNLCADQSVVVHHLDRLQEIDRITQSLRELSKFLLAPDPAKAIDGINLGELQRELRAFIER